MGLVMGAVAYDAKVVTIWDGFRDWFVAQGFEFDYVGVIWGRDLRWDPATNDWIGDPSHSHDAMVKRSGDRFTDLVKRTYRVLLTRGLKGCYAVFQDAATRQHVRQGAIR